MTQLRVLFVCRANIGRSQALREFTQLHLRGKPKIAQRVSVDSAGTSETIPTEVSDPARRSITPGLAELYRRAWNITHEMPTRKVVDASLLQQNDVVLVAEPRLKAELHSRFPSHAAKILTVKEYLWPSLVQRRQVIDDSPHPTTRRLKRMANRRQRNYKMLRECEGIARRLVQKWAGEP